VPYRWKPSKISIAHPKPRCIDKIKVVMENKINVCVNLLYITDIIQDTHLIKHQEKIKESTNPHS
jgi:hypothetical protein